MAGLSVAAIIAAVLIGFSKAGIKGISAFSVTLLALAYGAKSSTGIMLPLLVAGDIAAVIYYNKKCNWSLLLKLLPYVAIGVIIGAFIGDQMPEALFKKCMAAIIIISVSLMFWYERSTIQLESRSTCLGVILGLLAGITTMIGNLAGAFSNLFFLSMRLTKETFIGTAAWLFFVINIFKLPFHVFMWGTIDMSSLYIGLTLLPFLALGFIGGLKLIHVFNDQGYRYFIIVMTLIGALVMLIS
jgi:uncharacterized membrane protein YfcA